MKSGCHKNNRPLFPLLKTDSIFMEITLLLHTIQSTVIDIQMYIFFYYN